MKRFFCTSIFMLLGILLLTGSTARGEEESVEMGPFAMTATEKEQLLDRAQETILWFRSLSRESRKTTTETAFRFRIHPLQLMQAAWLTLESGQDDMSRILRSLFPYLRPTSAECFEIYERLGSEVLKEFEKDQDAIMGEGSSVSEQIRQGVDTFLREHLTSSEQLALFDSPSSPREIMDAVDQLVVSGRPMLVRYYLRLFNETMVEPEECAEIAEELGSLSLMQIANNPLFAPQGEEAVSRIYREAKAVWRDPEVIADALDEWVGSSGSGDEKLSETAKESLRVLWRGDRISISQIVAKLGDTENEQEVDELLSVLISLGKDAAEALKAALESENPVLVQNALLGLYSNLAPQDALCVFPVLFSASEKTTQATRDEAGKLVQAKLGRKPNIRSAVTALYLRANEYHQHDRALNADADGYVRFWIFDSKENKVRYIRMLPPAAYRYHAYRFARAASQIVTEDMAEYSAVKRLYLITLFERNAYLAGRDEPIDWNEPELKEALAQCSIPRLESILTESIRTESHAAAQVAASALGKRGSAKELLLSSDGRIRPLVKALAAPDRRVRFAALEAVMQLEPEEPYPGSSLLVDALQWFARADGRRVLVSAHPKQSIAAKTAGYFIGKGFQSEIATTGREAMKLAAASPDVEMLVIDLICISPSVPNLVQEMRSDMRTYNIPIAVLSDNPNVFDDSRKYLDYRPKSQMQKMDRMAPTNPFAVSLSRVYPTVLSEQSADFVYRDLMEMTSEEPVKPERRKAQAMAALQWLRELLIKMHEERKIYQFENIEETARNAMASDVRLLKGLELAAVISTNAMQNALYDLIASDVFPFELREKAAESFEDSVDRFGILLRGNQVQRLYDRYNASQIEEEKVQQLLSRVIDLIEDKTFNEKKDNPGPEAP